MNNLSGEEMVMVLNALMEKGSKEARNYKKVVNPYFELVVKLGSGVNEVTNKEPIECDKIPDNLKK